ncbi:glucosamine-fructose-6-phosphate aminotransferase [Cereibacter sediminicola]|uniref:glucosamine-fructose-6-phosphate aminotransferase n=1 Tax=Cereibacter sediminicola TaxID=2584941 RepID=UPI001FEC4706|nr:glucosamine-fructose-6-phosphate aminotransferase [Cereibacter sediminicola]
MQSAAGQPDILPSLGFAAGDVLHEARPRLRAFLDAGARRIFFVGPAGLRLLTLPAVQLIRRHSRFPAAASSPAELMLAPPRGLDAGALAVLVAAGPDVEAFLARRGVATCALTDPAPESLSAQALAIALALLAEVGAMPEAEAALEGLARLPAMLPAAARAFEPEAAALAAHLRGERYLIVTAPGSAWPVAHHFALDTLEKRLRIRARPVHASDFFHGTLELIEPGVSLLLVKGEDALRPLAERVESFVPRYTDRLWTIDAAAAELPGLAPQVRALASPVVLAALLGRVGAHLAPSGEPICVEA